MLRKWKRWSKSCSVIGYPSGYDGAILLVRDYPLCPARKLSLKAISLLGQYAWLDIGLVLFCVFMDRDGTRKKKPQYPAILTSRMVNKPHIRTVTVLFLFQDKYNTKAQSFDLPQSITLHHTCLSSICAEHCDFTWIHSPLLTERFCNICDQHGFVRISLAVIFWCTLRTCVFTEINALLNTIWQLIVANLLQKYYNWMEINSL